MIRTLLAPICWRTIDDNALRLIDTIRKTVDTEYYLFVPTTDNSYSFQANQAIVIAKNLRLDFVCLFDSDTFIEQEHIGWLQRFESCMDKNPDYGLILQGDQYIKDGSLIFANELQSTPHTDFGYCVVRLATNILFDEDYLYYMSSDVDFIREHRRHGWKTGCLSSFVVRHERKPYDNSRMPFYNKLKLRNEEVFNQKWGSICHNEFDLGIRNKWRGIYGHSDIDNLKDVSNQHLSIKPYFESTLFHNDCGFIKRNNLNCHDYYNANDYKQYYISTKGDTTY